MKNSQEPKPLKFWMDPKRIERNLLDWAEITALCIELRKSVLKMKHGIKDDEELTRMVFAEAVARKEQQWKTMRS